MRSLETELEWCLNQQRKCRTYLDGDGPDKTGAWMGLCDAMMEEAISRLNFAKETADIGLGPTSRTDPPVCPTNAGPQGGAPSPPSR